MSWEKSIEELRKRERLAEEMGGDEPVARQRSRGKLTVRELLYFTIYHTGHHFARMEALLKDDQSEE